MQPTQSAGSVQRAPSLTYIPQWDEHQETEWCLSQGDTRIEIGDSDESQVPLPQVTGNENERIAFWSYSAQRRPATSAAIPSN